MSTVRTLTNYQITSLGAMFMNGCDIKHIGRVDEDGVLIVHFSGGPDNYDGIVTTKKIPLRPDYKMSSTDDAPCEIIQPKQLNDANNHQTSQPV